jgi:hypothetical protein
MNTIEYKWIVFNFLTIVIKWFYSQYLKIKKEKLTLVFDLSNDEIFSRKNANIIQSNWICF